MRVQAITSRDAVPFIMGVHYAQRMCPISHAFGLFDGHKMVGVVTYGTPASSPLKEGVCGEAWYGSVLELNRLCCNQGKNFCSILVGRSLALLPKPSIVVSYADTSMGHVGYVYQATNFIYTGLSAKRTDWNIEGIESHGYTVADKSRGMENRAQWMRETFGDRFSLKDRPRKHRYVFFCGSRKDRKRMLSDLKYPVLPYPKGESRRYECEPVHTQSYMLF